MNKSKTFSLSELRIRDPFIVVDKENNRYLMYSQIGNRICNDMYNGGIECFSSTDFNNWKPEGTVALVDRDFKGYPPFWAPEIHEINGKWYLFFSCLREEGEDLSRGTIILRSATPLGPFKNFGKSPQTPKDEESLDGTFWRDDNKQSWMIYCHEWCQVKDGKMKAIRLKEDMSTTIGDPIHLFNASEAPWTCDLGAEENLAGRFVTDGCFLYKTRGGVLLMLWSSFISKGHYAIGIACSQNGKTEGPWTHDDAPLFDENGGHGMIFTGLDGQLYLAIHCPNDSNMERLKLFKLIEENNTLRIIE